MRLTSIKSFLFVATLQLIVATGTELPGNTQSVKCDPSQGPCAGSKKPEAINKDSWPSFDALCMGQNCKIVISNESIQIGGTKIPRNLVTRYKMEDKSNYSCQINGRPCNPILVGSVYYREAPSAEEQAAVFEFRNTKPVVRLNAELKQWLGGQ